MEQESNRQQNGVYSKVIRAGRRRTYFFDVRSTKNDEFYLTITESKKRFDSDSYERHKVHVYKEDFHKFINAIEDVVTHIKSLMPNYDYDEFTRPAQTINYDDDGNPIREEREEYSENLNEANPDNTTESQETEVQETESPVNGLINDDDLKWD